MDYWGECIRIALEEAGLSASEEQIDTIVSAVEGDFENYSLARGYETIPKHSQTIAEKALQELQQEIEKEKVYISTIKPCKSCNTTGSVLDIWNREIECFECSGKGRVKL